MCPSLIEIGSKTAEKNLAQTNKQTDKPTDTKKIMVTWPWTKKAMRMHRRQLHTLLDIMIVSRDLLWELNATFSVFAWSSTRILCMTAATRVKNTDDIMQCFTRDKSSWLTDYAKVLHSNWTKIGHLGDVLSSQSLDFLLKQVNLAYTDLKMHKNTTLRLSKQYPSIQV